MLLPSSYLSKSFLLNSRIGLNPLAILILPAFSNRLRTSTVRYTLEYSKLIDKIKRPIRRTIMSSFFWGQMLFERFPAFSGFLKLLILIHQVSQQSLGNKGHVRHKVLQTDLPLQHDRTLKTTVDSSFSMSVPPPCINLITPV